MSIHKLYFLLMSQVGQLSPKKNLQQFYYGRSRQR